MQATQGKCWKIVTSAAAALTLTGGSLWADYVDFTGLSLSSSGTQTFTMATSGTSLATSVSLSGFAATTGNSSIVNGPQSALLRFNSGSAANGNTVSSNVTFGSAQTFTISAFSGSNALPGQPNNNALLPSNLTDYDQLTFTAINPAVGFSWSLLDASFINIVSNVGNTITIQGTKPPTSPGQNPPPYGTFDLTADLAAEGFLVTYTSTNLGPGNGQGNNNSVQLVLDVQVVPEPTATALVLTGSLTTLVCFRRRRAAVIR